MRRNQIIEAEKIRDVKLTWRRIFLHRLSFRSEPTYSLIAKAVAALVGRRRRTGKIREIGGWRWGPSLRTTTGCQSREVWPIHAIRKCLGLGFQRRWQEKLETWEMETERNNWVEFDPFTPLEKPLMDACRPLSLLKIHKRQSEVDDEVGTEEVEGGGRREGITCLDVRRRRGRGEVGLGQAGRREWGLGLPFF